MKSVLFFAYPCETKFSILARVTGANRTVVGVIVVSPMYYGCKREYKRIPMYFRCILILFMDVFGLKYMSNNGEISNRTIVITLRLTPGLLRFIEEDITTNEIHRTRSDWIQTALEHYMKERMEDAIKLRELRGGGDKIMFDGDAHANARVTVGGMKMFPATIVP